MSNWSPWLRTQWLGDGDCSGNDGGSNVASAPAAVNLEFLVLCGDGPAAG